MKQALTQRITDLVRHKRTCAQVALRFGISSDAMILLAAFSFAEKGFSEKSLLLKKPKSTLSRWRNELSRKKFIEVSISSDDHRKNEYSCTARGSAAVAELENELEASKVADVLSLYAFVDFMQDQRGLSFTSARILVCAVEFANHRVIFCEELIERLNIPPSSLATGVKALAVKGFIEESGKLSSDARKGYYHFSRKGMSCARCLVADCERCLDA